MQRGQDQTRTTFQLCIWKASHARPPAGANTEHAAPVETKHTTLTGSLEPKENRYTSGESSCLMSFTFLLFLPPVSYPPIANQTSAVGTRQITQHGAQRTFPGKNSAGPQNIDTASSFTRSALKLPETTRARPPPEDRIAEPDPDIKTKTEPRTSAASPLLTTTTLSRTPPTLTTPGWHPAQNPHQYLGTPTARTQTARTPTPSPSTWTPDVNAPSPGPQRATKRPRRSFYQDGISYHTVFVLVP